jgi:formylglycine-generating enzyme required for sulfatase activity
MKNIWTFLFLFLLPWALSGAPVPYAGKVAKNGVNFSGTAEFTFSIVEANGTTHWINGADPNEIIEVPVNAGRYLVLLGGQGMNPLPTDLFLTHPELYLKVMVDLGDGQGLRHLAPDQHITSVPHALTAVMANLAKAVEPGAITKSMLAAEVLADLNATVVLPEQNATIQTGSITRSMLAPGVLSDLNATIAPGSITAGQLAPALLADLNRSVVITRNMLPASVLADLNRTITRNMLPASVLADLNRTITKNLLGNDVLADLNASVAISRLPAEVKAFLAPRIVTQPPAQVTGYAGRSIHIPAVADGRQLSYQWRRAGQPVAGATSPILHLADLNASTDPGSYSLVVTNPFGSVTSSATQLTVATVVPNDIDLPVLTLNGQKSISLLTGTAWLEPGFSATDDLDGNLTAVVDVNGTVNVAIPGAYFITYKATDSAGNFATAQRVVTVSNFIDLCLIPAGTFQMGNVWHAPPTHEVYVSAFYTGKYELTQTIWDEVRLWATDPARGANVYQFDNNGTAEGPNFPVANVSWYDMVKWCNARSEKENLQPLYYRESNQSTIYRTEQVLLTNAHANWQANGWRLPTEAEWEKAARGGLVGMSYPNGNSYSPAYGNIIESGIDKTVSVGSYAPNGYGLHNIFGNVREIIWDGYEGSWYNQPVASLPNPRGPEHSSRSRRGGGFSEPSYLNSLHRRMNVGISSTADVNGFRLARNAPDAVAGGYPTLTSSPDANGTAGQSFSYQILAGDSPAAYGATGLPAGLSVNASTGLISGTVNAVGDHNATISATNAAGTTSMTLSLHFLFSTWDKRFGGSETDVAYDVIATADGGYLIVGDSNSTAGGDRNETSRGGHDFWAVKIDADGSKVWDKRFGGSGDESCRSVVATTDGGYLLVGESNSTAGGDKTESSRGGKDYWAVKIDTNGSKVWDKRFGGSESDVANDVVATSDGGYLLVGKSESGADGDKSEASRGGWDYWAVKVDANGSKVWDKRFGASTTDYCVNVVVTSDGGYLLAGHSNSGANGDKSEGVHGYFDYWVVKIGASGNKVWDKRFGGSGKDHCFTAVPTSDGGYLLAGRSKSGANSDKSEASQGDYDYWAVKIDASGAKLWDKRFGGSGLDDCLSIVATTDGGYLLAGYSGSEAGGDKSEASRGGNDYWAVKINSSGGKLWDKRFGGSAGDATHSVIATSDGGYLLVGNSASGTDGDKSEATRGNSDFWAIKVDANGNK